MLGYEDNVKQNKNLFHASLRLKQSLNEVTL